MTATRRVVITGIGVQTPLGNDVDQLWKAFLAGQSGVRQVRAFDTSGLPTRIAGEIDGFDAKAYVEKNQRKSLRVMARPIQLGVAAAQSAMLHGQVDKAKLDPARFGIEFGAGLIATELPDIGDASRASTNCQPGKVDLVAWGEKGLPAIQPLWMLKYLPNMPACHISILHNAQGPNNSITESDASSLLALGEAARILRRNGADIFLVGGCESKLNPLSMVRQCLHEDLSRRNDEPEKACRPFDASRDGLVLGEGAAVFVVEGLDHAQKRGGRILAEVVGFGAAFEHKFDGDGLARACAAALRQAGITADELDHVNAHGLGTRKEDVWEARGLGRIVGTRVPVHAFKGAIGNLGAASGTAELALSIQGLANGVMPGTVNHEKTDPNCPIAVHTGSPRAGRTPYALKVGFTLMGQCAAVIVKKWE